MQVKTILNRVYRQRGFVFTDVKLVGKKNPCLHAHVRCRKGSRGICSKCHKPRPGYDTLPERKFEFIPIWGILVYLLYAMRRVDCPSCGVTVEEVPWAEGKGSLTKAYVYYLAHWAKRMSWSEVATAFHTSWEKVYRAVATVVEWGLAHRNLDGIKAIGVDEVLWKKGYQFLTVVYQIDDGCRRLLWVGKDRTEKTLRGFFRMLGRDRSSALQYVCSDMWKPYLNVMAEKAKQAIHILDRFHIMANMNKAIDEVRAKEARGLKAQGKGLVLKNTRWILLKRPENLRPWQASKLRELVGYNLRSVRAYLAKEFFQLFWTYDTPAGAAWFLDFWCKQVMRSKIEPMKKIARSLRVHKTLIVNWFRARGMVSTGAVEGLNNRLKVITRRSFGFRTLSATKIALYHALGDLPDPGETELAHRFY